MMGQERFQELVSRWHDGDASPAECAEIEAVLKAEPSRRRSLVEFFLLESDLYAAFGTTSSGVHEAAEGGPVPAPVRHFAERAAAVLIFAVTAGALAFLYLRPDERIPAAPWVPRIHPPPVDMDGGRVEKQLQATTIDLSRAIEISLREAGGGAAIEAQLEEEDGRLRFSVDVAVDRKVLEVQVDARTGALLGKKTEDDDQSRLAGLFKVTLVQAVDAAVRAAPGRPFEADLELDDGKARVKVRLVSGEKVLGVTIDATGEVLKVREEENKRKKGGEEQREKSK